MSAYVAAELTGWAKKRGHRFMTIILPNLNRFTIFFTGRFLGKFAVTSILKIPQNLAYVAQQNKPLTTDYKVV